MDDLHWLHLSSLTWTEVASCSWPDPWTATSALRPLPRALHTLTHLPGTSLLALYGGLGQLHAPLQDLWLLEMDSLDWEEVELEKLDRRQEKQLPKRLVNMIIGGKVVEGSARAAIGGDGEETQYCRERLRAGV